MAKIIIETTPEEQAKVLKVLESLKGEVTPVSAIACMAGLSQSRTRYVLVDLVDSGKVEKVAHKAFNKYYVRYSYNVL
jgi:Fic family protein